MTAYDEFTKMRKCIKEFAEINQQLVTDGMTRFQYVSSCQISIIPYRTKFRRTKFSTSSRNFDNFVQFLPEFSIEIIDTIFDGQNFSSDKIFDIKPKFRQFCPNLPDFCIEILDKSFDGQNFRHQAEISTILSDELLSDRVLSSFSQILIGILFL